MAVSKYTTLARHYAEAVVAGDLPACRWVQLACQRQLNDLARFKGKGSPYQFNPKLLDQNGRPFHPADNLCAFIERLPHVKGPQAGEPIKLEQWQAFILTTVFGWVKPDGKRRFRRSYIEVPRGNAKSTLSSAVALYMLAADREGGAEVYSLATTRDQARIVFGDAQTMARKSAGFRNRFGVAVGAHNMHVLASGSKFEALSAEGSTLDGLNIHFGCVDELHAHKTRTVYDVVETGTGKRNNSLLWVITTAGSNRAGICYEVRTFVTRMLDGVFEDDSQFGIIYGLDTEPYVQSLPPMAALTELEKSCNCGRVHPIQIENLWGEVCANLATTAGTVQKAQNDAQSTLTDLSERVACAEAATNNGCSTVIQNTKQGVYESARSGLRGIKRKSAKHTVDGEQNQATPNRCVIGNDTLNTGFLPRNTSDGLPNSMVSVRSANQRETLSAWITATAQELFGDSSAPNAIQHLAFSEILKRVYDAHLPTCKARALEIVSGRLHVKRQPDDWTSDSALIKANPNWGISVQPEVLLPLQAKAMQMPSATNNFKTKHLNEWVNADTAWMDMRAWDACSDATLDLDDFAGQPCWIGLDLASKTDIAAMVLVFRHPEIAGGHAVFGRYYLPEDTVNGSSNSQYSGWMRAGRLTVTPGNVIDFSWIEADLIDFASRFEIQAVAFDPFQATQLSTRMLEEGLPMIEVRPTVLNFSEPMKTVEALVLQKKLIHDNDPVLTWMASNVVAHLDAKDNIYPRKERPENKIDGIVALIMAISRSILPGEAVVLDADYELMLL